MTALPPAPTAPSRLKWSASIEAFTDGRKSGLMLLKVSGIDLQKFPAVILQQPQTLAEVVLPGEALCLCPMGAGISDGHLVLSFYSSLLAATGTLPRTVCLILEPTAFERPTASVPVKLISEVPKVERVPEESRPTARPRRTAVAHDSYEWREAERHSEERGTESAWPVAQVAASLTLAAAYSALAGIFLRLLI
ncbi:MAG: hypothetical protein R3C59_30155 [Planctomycetaceae bacterium]